MITQKLESKNASMIMKFTVQIMHHDKYSAELFLLLTQLKHLKSKLPVRFNTSLQKQAQRPDNREWQTGFFNLCSGKIIVKGTWHFTLTLHVLIYIKRGDVWISSPTKRFVIQGHISSCHLNYGIICPHQGLSCRITMSARTL